MLLQDFENSIKKERHKIRQGKTLLLTVSGGVDSVVLADLFYKLNMNFVIAHCNFQLRGAESERDEQFVRNLGQQYKKEVHVKRFETNDYASANKISIQEAARKLRYQWFQQLVDEQVANVITTAHHADDNIETVVMNFFRGTGLKGLTGISSNEIIYRPLLPFRKSELLDYAEKNRLTFVEDSSNASNKYTRNFFRNKLLPSIKDFFPTVEENILQNVERLAEVEQVYNKAIKDYKEKLVELKGDEEHIPILKLQKTTPVKTIVWEIIKDKGFTAPQVDEVIKLMSADNGSYIKSELHRIIKNRKWLIITKISTDAADAFKIIDAADADQKVFEKERLLFEHIINNDTYKISHSSEIANIDADKVAFPLILRKWKQGDYFYPLGMKKKKKLSKFFIDQKLSLTDKEKVRVLEMNKKIMWVVGLRIDDRFKIETSTKNILRISLTHP